MAQRLCFVERVRIEEMVRAGLSSVEVAECLGRHPTTVQRELARGAGACGYVAVVAQRRCEARAARPKSPKLVSDKVLAGAVAERLRQRWSPHAISADLKADGVFICAETIYRACYANSTQAGLNAGSWRKLPKSRRRRRHRRRIEQAKRSVLGDYRPVAERPAAAADRTEPGHWEGDLIIGAANQSAAATLVERVSRYTLVIALPDGYDAENTAAAVTAALRRQPKHLVKTLTWDQGTEIARWKHIETELGIEVYICEPRSPWQRPSNEQTNGLLRRWIPKGTNLNIGPLHLSIIADNLNHMPRKLHQWESAHTIYTQQNCNHR